MCYFWSYAKFFSGFRILHVLDKTTNGGSNISTYQMCIHFLKPKVYLLLKFTHQWKLVVVYWSLWHYGFLGLHDFSQYSSWSRFFHWFPIRSVLSPSSGRSLLTHQPPLVLPLDPHVPQLFKFSDKVQVFIYLFTFIFTLWYARTVKSTRKQILFFVDYR